MPKWIVDAKDITIDDYSVENLLLTTPAINNFLEIIRDNKFFVMATKGYGKTFLLKIKSLRYQRKNIPNLHKDKLVDKPGSDNIIFDADKASCFRSITNWSLVWTVSIALSIFKNLKLLDNITHKDPLLDELCDAPSVTITNYCRNIIQLNRKDFYQLSKLLDKYMLPLLNEISTPVTAFLDNVDEFLEKHINIAKYKGPSSEGVVNEDIWYNAQIGLVEAIYQMNSMNDHIKIFASIRKEAFIRLKSYDSRYTQFKSNGIDLFYTKEQLREIFIINIKKEGEINLVHPNALNRDPIYSFCGIKTRRHTTVKGDEEDIFDFIYRHTLQRPRDLMLIGGKISEIKPAERTSKNLTSIVNKAASDISTTYINELHPHLISFPILDVFKYIQSNILTINAIKDICSIYNEKDCHGINCDTCTEDHVFCTLFKVGLLGVIKTDIHRGAKFQKFIAPGEEWYSITERLPQSEYYLIHPAIYELLLNANPDFEISDSIIVGHDRKWQEQKDEPLLAAQKKIHVHFGAGKMGLGLVVPLMCENNQIIIIQRPSPKWDNTKYQDYLTINLNGTETFKFNFYHEQSGKNLDDILDLISTGNNVFICSGKMEILGPIIENAYSISTALDTGLDYIVNVLEGLKFPQKVNLYPFENDHTAVERLREKLSKKNNSIDVINLIPDRICPERKIDRKNIMVKCESYANVVVRGANKDVYDLFSNNPNVIVADSNEEYDFYYKKKFWLLNSIHMIMAIYGYEYLHRKAIPYENWKIIPLTIVFDADPDCKRDIDIFIKIQSLRLVMETPSNLLEKIYRDQSSDKIFDNLIQYGNEVQFRIEKTVDEINRVLDINVTEPKKLGKLQTKLRDRIDAMIKFIKEKEIAIKELNITGKPDINEMLKVMIDLRGKLLNVFFKILENLSKQAVTD